MNDEQRHIDAWFKSIEGKSCTNIRTLDIHIDNYLRNRIWKAFIAGMDAGKLIEKNRISKKLRELIR